MHVQLMAKLYLNEYKTSGCQRVIKNNLIVDLENVVGQTWKYYSDSIQCQENLFMKIVSCLICMVHCMSHDAVD